MMLFQLVGGINGQVVITDSDRESVVISNKVTKKLNSIQEELDNGNYSVLRGSALKSVSLKSSSLKSGTLGVIDCLEPEYCHDEARVHLSPNADFEVSGATYVWEAFKLVPTNTRPDYIEEEDGEYYFLPNAVVEEDLGSNIGIIVYRIESGVVTETRIDYTVVKMLPSLYDFGNSGVICDGSNLVLDLSGSDYDVGDKTTYKLYKEGEGSEFDTQEGTGSVLSFSVSEAGTYYVVAENNILGCPLEMNGRPVVTVNSNPVVTTSGNVSICSGLSTTISATSDMDPDVTYTWDDGSGGEAEYTGASWEVSPTVSTTYTVTATNNTTGCNVQSDVIVSVNANPTITANSNSPVCQGSSINLTSSPNGGSGVYSSFTWTGPNNFSTQNATIATSALSDAGDYYVTVTDNNGCSSDGTDMTTVIVSERPTVSVSYNNPVCLNTQLLLTTSPLGGSGSYSNYVWTKDGVVISGENSSTLSIASAQLTDAATYGVSVEDDSGCISDESTVVVIINSLPIVSAGNDGDVCEGGTLNLSGGSNGMSSYLWTGPDSYVSSEQNPQITNITLAQDGIYTLEIVDGNGCVNSTTTDVVVNANPTITANSNSPVCQGSSIDLTSTPNGGSGVYTNYSWTGPNNFSTQNGTIATSALSDAGDYYVTVTDNNGCSSDGTDMTTVVVTERPTVSVSYNNPVCLNTQLLLTAAPSGGSGNYVNYVWTKDGVVISGENSSTLSIASAQLTDAATYGVSVEDDSGCISDESTVAVLINTLPVVSAGNDGDVCEGGTLNLSGGSNGMSSYSWTGPDSYTSSEQNPQITNITLAQDGIYTLEIVDGNGCINSTTTDVVVNENPTITASSNSPVCLGSSIDLTSTPNGGSGVYTNYSWTGPNNFSTQNATIATSVLSDAGDYYVTVTDNNGCSSSGTDMTTVVVTERPTVSVSYNNPVCLNTQLLLTATPSGGSGNYVNYVWTKDGVVISGENSSSLSITSAQLTDAATYGVSVEDDSGCISDESTVAVLINTLPVVSAGNDGDVCEGGTLNLSGGSNGMSSYSWTGPDSYTSSEQNPQITNITLAQDGTYTLEIVDGNGCINSTTTDVVVNENPTIAASSNSPVCLGSSIDLTSTPNGGSGVYTNYSWTGPNNFSSQNANIATSTLTDAGDYYVTVTDNNGCSSSGSDFTTVVVNELPTVTLSSSYPLCVNSDVTLTATAAGGSGNYVNYIWTKDGSVISGENASTLTISSVQQSDDGVYGVTVIDNITCSSEETTITIDINDLPVVTASNSGAVCEGKSVDLQGGENGMVSYSWSGPNSFTSSIQNPTISDIPSTGAGTYTLVIEDANGCQNTASTDIFVNRLTSSINITAPSVGETKFCENTEVTFTATAEEGSGNYTYDFHLIRNSVDNSVKNSADDSYVTTTLEDGDQIYVLILDNTSGCTESSSILTVEIVTEPTPVLDITSAGANVVCLNTPVDFSATPGYDRYIFYNNGTDVLQDGASNLLTTATLSDGNVITVEAFTGACSGISNEITMTVNDLPTVSLVIDDGETIACENETVNFTATGTGAGTLTYQFLVDGTIEQAISETNTFSHSSTNDFSVQVRVYDDNNCEILSDPIDITISKPVASLNIDNPVVCAETEVTYTAGGGVSYEFFVNSSSVQGPDVSNTYSSSILENNDIVSVEVTDNYGCTANEASSPITVNPIPNVSVSTDKTEICAGEEVTFVISGGDTFAWYLNNTLIDGQTSSTYVTTTLSDGDIITGRGSYGSTGCYAEASAPAITVHPLPTASLNVSPDNSIISGTLVTFTADGGTEYVYSINGIVDQSRSSNNEYTSDVFADNDIVTVDVYDGNNCMSSESVTMNVFDDIILFDVLATENSYCEGGSGVSVYLGGTPQDGVTYELLRSSDNSLVGSSIMYSSATPVDVRWDDIKGTEEYRIEAYYTSVPAERYEMNNRVTIEEYSLPVIYNLSPTGSETGCNGGSGHVVSLDNSETGVSYTLLLDGTPVEVLSGIDGTQLDFTAQLGIGSYTIIAENDISGCQRYMSGTFEIVGDGSDVAFNVYVVDPADETDLTDGRYCEGGEGVVIGLDGSLDNTVTYKLYNDGNDTGISELGNNGPISFGTVTDEGTYTVRVESASGCQFPMDGYADVSVIPTPTQFNVLADNDGHYCEGDAGVTMSIDSQEEGVEYSLYLDGVTLIETLTGSDALGTPLVFSGVHNAEGVYSVVATVPEVECSISMNNTIEVQVDALPTAYDLTSDGDYCSGSSTYIHMPGSESDVEYRWHNLDDDTFGSAITGTGGVLDIEVYNTGNYEIVAQRTDGVTSCSSVMNGTFDITEKPLPDATKIISESYEGTGCDDGSIVTVILSESGVEYTLVKNVGSNYYDAGLPSIVGDGNDISFDPIVDKDNAEYTAIANLDGCTAYLNNSVFIDITGVVSKQIVTGSGEICNGDPGVVFGLDDTESGVSYELWLADPEGATNDVLKETITGDGSAINFSAVGEEGEYYVMGVSSNCTLEMANRVELNVNPLPEAYKMIGSGEYCDITEGALISLDNSEEGVSYMLQFDDGSSLRNALTSPALGGAITDTIDFGRFTEIGSYTVIATTDKGCTSSMNGVVTTQLSTAPIDQTVEYDSDRYCQDSEGVELRLTDHEGEVVYQVIDVSTNTVVAEVIDEDTSGSGELSLGIYSEGTYSFVASRGGDACEISINGGNTITLTMVPQPTEHTVYADEINVCGSEGTNVGIVDSEVGIEYRIEDSTGAILETKTSESGEAISWLVSDIGTSEIYEIFAIAEAGCDLSMGTIEVEFKDAPSIPDYELDATEYCEGENGITITIHNTELEVGYQLKDIDGKTNGFDDGNGGDIIFDNIEEGEYYIIARNYENGCATYSTENFTIVMNSTPNVEIFQIGTYDCSDICYGLVSNDELVLDNSAPEEDGTVYTLLLDGLEIDPAVDSIGKGDVINYGARNEAGTYTVLATSTKGCTAMMEGSVYLEEFPLDAVDDYLNLSKGQNAGTLMVSGEDEIVNDTWNINVDLKGDNETGVDGNLRFLLDETDSSINSKDISSGSVTLDPVSSILVYTKKPGFFGKDSVQYYLKNINFTAPRERIDSAWVHIFVGNKELDGDNSFVIPNAFSPNGDDINDYFRISGIEESGIYSAEKSKLEVFNRWGVLVYRSSGDAYGQDDEWWDGTSTTANMVSIGSDLPNGTYFYVYTVTVNEATEDKTTVKKYSGYIELRR